MTARHFYYLIIGNSAGGIGAAEAIREFDRERSIGIVSDEPYPVYSRPLISEYLANPRPVENFLYRKPGFYEENDIQTLLGVKFIGIDPTSRTLMLASGGKLRYEKLLLATGGKPVMPPLPGIESSGLFTFNRLDDACAIDRFISRHHRRMRAVVIGGGLIGVSAAEALLRRNVDVTMLEMQDRILSAMLDEEASAIEAEALKEAGVVLVTGRTAERINSAISGDITSVTLDNGTVIHCEMVIVAIGVRPRVDGLEGSGILINRGIVVDRKMSTFIPGIYACGDVAEAYDFIYRQNRLTPVWPNAYEGGRTAGLNMAGQEAEYAGGTAMNSMKYFGKHIVSAGLVNAPDDSYETMVHAGNGDYRKVIVRDGKIQGLVFAGDIEKSGIVYNLMKNGVDVTAFKDTLVADSFGLASLPEEVWRQHIKKPADSISAITKEPEEALIGD